MESNVFEYIKEIAKLKGLLLLITVIFWVYPKSTVLNEQNHPKQLFILSLILVNIQKSSIAYLK